MDIYATIDYENNPPINGFYQTMMRLSLEQREQLKRENATSPQPIEEDMQFRLYSQKLKPHHKEGSFVQESNFQVGYLKDVTRYGAMFHPLYLQKKDKEKVQLYISIRDAYQCLYSYETEMHEENKEQRASLNASYNEFMQRFGLLNARENVKLIIMDASGRDVLSLERVEEERFVKADDLPVLQDMVNSTWKKEGELRKLKGDLAALDRKIQATIGRDSLNIKKQDSDIVPQSSHHTFEKR